MTDDVAPEALTPFASVSAPAPAAGAELELGALGPSDACPFLAAESGAWRLSTPSRDHRCGAFSPSTSLAPSKQARLCLTAAHTGCATYVASNAAREARVGPPQGADRAGRWALARMTPVVEDIGGARALLGALVADRRTWPAIPAVLLVTLLVALGLSGAGGAPVTALGSPTPGLPQSSSPASARPTVTAAVPTQTTTLPSPTTVVSPTVAPTATPVPNFSTTYRVKSGDTLFDIALQFHTTVKAITDLNNLTSTTLHIGQLLLIP